MGGSKREKQEGKKEKIFKGPLTFLNQSIEKDFVISKISDAIIPLPHNIRVNILIEDDRSVVILEVDGSEYGPHQTGNKYYMRIDGQTRLAPHHYIEALFKKIRFPTIENILQIREIRFDGQSYKLTLLIHFVNWSPFINEESLSFVMITNGKFVPENSSEGQLKVLQEAYSWQNQKYSKSNAKGFLPYGETASELVTLSFGRVMTTVSKNRFPRLTITFGGRFSPRKVSEYTFNLNLVDHGFKDYQSIIEKNENKLLIDIQQEKNLNKELLIKAILDIPNDND